jgi:hypothetical protein
VGVLAESMPQLALSQEELRQWGVIWRSQRGSAAAGGEPRPARASPAQVPTEVRDQAATLAERNYAVNEDQEPIALRKKNPDSFDKKQGMDFSGIFDHAFGAALAKMLGDIPIRDPTGRPQEDALLPPDSDCVEVGSTRIIGGIRPQNFDVAYRPDGVRIAYDSKTLNDKKSIQKNWQNMINDLGTEATTVHTRFPYAIVAFIVAVPKPALMAGQAADIVRTLERMTNRRSVLDQAHLAEAMALVVWNPDDGLIDPDLPPNTSPLRIEKLSEAIYRTYMERYKGLPPHDK